jgi:uncharacterized membrane protein
MEIMELVMINLLMGVVLLIIALLVKRYPPDAINHVYGYRTKRSKKSRHTWKYANELSIKYMFYVAFFSLIMGVVSIVIGSIDLSLWITYAPSVLALFGMIFVIEMKLKRKFDDEGNPRDENKGA